MYWFYLDFKNGMRGAFLIYVKLCSGTFRIELKSFAFWKSNVRGIHHILQSLKCDFWWETIGFFNRGSVRTVYLELKISCSNHFIGKPRRFNAWSNSQGKQINAWIVTLPSRSGSFYQKDLHSFNFSFRGHERWIFNK